MDESRSEAGDADEHSPRLQVYLARCGIASRRACEKIILEGRVCIDGSVVSRLGSRVPPGSRVTVDGVPVAPVSRMRYILLNKPPGYLSAMADPEGRPLAYDLIKNSVAERVYNVGRLDQWSSGLLIFTNDGELAKILVHPSGGIEKEYEVIADAPLPDAFFSDFRRGTSIDGVVYRAREARRTGSASARIVLIEGKNREIRRFLEHYGLRARLLKRIRIGSVSIENLAEGSFRELTEAEVASLKSNVPFHGGRSR